MFQFQRMTQAARGTLAHTTRLLHRHSWHYQAAGLRHHAEPTGCRLGAGQSAILDRLKQHRALKKVRSKYHEETAWEQSLAGTVGDLRPGESLTDEELDEATHYSVWTEVTPKERHWHARTHHYPYMFQHRR